MLNRQTHQANQTDAAKDKSPRSAPAIALPKGGGAIRGIGEKFTANAVTGTGSLSVPILTSPSRSDFYPQLSLSYDSGAGNGPFGFGWHLSVPAITRKTDKGLPRYQDDDDSDVFILSGAEDLVPTLIHSGKSWIGETLPPGQVNGEIYTVRRYRPRVEGLFARIERWMHRQTGDVFWKSVTKDNVTSLFGLPEGFYGKSSNSRIFDPGDPSHTFTWLLELSYDDKGNVIVYDYQGETDDNVDPALHEQSHQISANRYLKHIQYGNLTPWYPGDGLPLPADAEWAFHVVFDYGGHDLARPRIDPDTKWACRPDAFSSYRAGFEVRTYRLCRRVLMFHQLAELGKTECLVRSTDFAYNQGPVASFLTSVTQTGYLRNPLDETYQVIDPQTQETLSPKSLPPLEFAYTEAQVDEGIHFVDAASLENLPVGLDGAHYQWVDLDSEGLPGILTEQAQAWFYKRNLGNVLPGDADGQPQTHARFAPTELVASRPSLADLRSGQQLMELAGDGQKCLVQFSGPLPGYYELDEDGHWQPFTPFLFSPKVDWNSPNLKFVDLNGDGFPDILITEDEVLAWYPSRARDGFGPRETVRKFVDEDKGPALVFADGTQSIYLADMAGDGLTDIVRIRNGEVCYWPNLGYGRFGAKITMDAAPVFDYPDYFDQRRFRLGDIDGSGTTDLLYLGRDTVTFWFNQSGNSWSAPHQLTSFPAVDDLASVVVIDLLGNGTACLVWSSPLPGDAGRPMQYIDLMGGQKPHLLQSVKNNLGAETKIQYAASTKFYLQDRAAGNPWITKLPFPVHVVERVETYDYVSETKLVTLYKYHHGYFDGPEREFRGFGMVEQWDTESFSKYAGVGLFTQVPQTDGEEFHLPPVHTRTWFHTGAYLDRDNISQHFIEEYYKGDPLAMLLPDTPLPSGLTLEEEREACRTLKGMMLRQEVYADDAPLGSSEAIIQRARTPYTVVEQDFTIRLLQPRAGNRHAVFFTHPREALTYHYERKLVPILSGQIVDEATAAANPNVEWHPDPRIQHALTLEVDEFGNATKSAAVGYPRRPPTFGQPPHPPEQTQTLITYTESQVANKPEEADWYRLGVPVETRTYELTGTQRTEDNALYTVEALLTAGTTAAEIQYEEKPDSNVLQKRLIEYMRTLYLKNDMSKPLALGEVESLALPYEVYKLAFTSGLLANVYGGRIDDALLRDEGKYLQGADYKALNLFPMTDEDAIWWIPSGRSFYSPDPAKPDLLFARNHFYLAQGSQDPFGNVSRVTHDAYNLLVVQAQDALGNIVSAQNNYRTMQPEQVTDPNDNRSAVRFDALGMVVAMALMGKDGQFEGDTLNDPTTRLEYDLFNWRNNQQPNYVHIFAREQHGAANPRWQESYSYSDGMGREVMKKVQAEPGLAPARDANGNLERDANSNLIWQSTNSRWVGTGRTVFDNTGNAIKKYEPFFDSALVYEDETDLAQWGVTPILRYDPLGRLIRTDLPNSTFSTVEFDAWQQMTSDQNDTVRNSKWYADRSSPDPSGPEPTDPEVRAAWLAAKHADTPATAHFDTLGRPFLTIADNGAAGQYETRVELDIEGNHRSITDALGRKVMTYDYDMLSKKIHQVSVDAGERWMLNDVAGKPIYAWDSLGHAFQTQYDELRRPLRSFVKGADSQDTNREILFERIIYGDGPDTGLSEDQRVQANLRGKPYEHLDNAGLVTNVAYDFKGNLLHSRRQLAQDYTTAPDWSRNPLLESETFNTTTQYDALNRPIQILPPHSDQPGAKLNVIRPGYNAANLLETTDAWLQQATEPQALLDPDTADLHAVTNIDYNAKGQRELIEYGSQTRTEYAYDDKTFRLIRLATVRLKDNAVLQNLRYTYDPVGNITQIYDDAQPTIFFDNARVEPLWKHSYDALYRLTQAEGREHTGQTVYQPAVLRDNYRDYPFVDAPNANDPQAMRTYTEEFDYDSVGNILRMAHQAKDGNWTRRYAYDPNSNRLQSTSLPGDSDTAPYSATYQYDAHGNMTTMPHLPLIVWDYRDLLQATSQQVVNDGRGEATYYVYDSNGQRVCKVTVKPQSQQELDDNVLPTRIKEGIYLGGFEIYREYNAASGAVDLERETLHVMDDKRRVALVETKTVDVDAPVHTLPSTLTRYQYDNHLGSACLELDAAGLVISYEEYYPYGSTSYQAVRSNVEVSPKRYRYTGKERDEETGLYYHGARHYVPWLGKWASCDPAGMVDGTNLYLYGRDNPIAFSDSTGRQSQKDTEETLSHTVNRGGYYEYDQHKRADTENSQSPVTPSPTWGLGLRNAEHMAPAVEDITQVRSAWPYYSSDSDRAHALLDIINSRLEASGMPAVHLGRPLSEKDSAKGIFFRKYWEIHVKLSHFGHDRDFGEALDIILHEARHAEQAFYMARYLAGQGRIAELKLPLYVAKVAARQPLPSVAEPGGTINEGLGAEIGRRLFMDQPHAERVLQEPAFQEEYARKTEAIARTLGRAPNSHDRVWVATEDLFNRALAQPNARNFARYSAAIQRWEQRRQVVSDRFIRMHMADLAYKGLLEELDVRAVGPEFERIYHR